MKRFYAISIAIVLSLVESSSAQLPNINTGSVLQNRATVRVPGVDASNASRIRAGTNLDSSRLRLNANTRAGSSVRAGGVRISGQTNAAVETRRRARNNRNADPGRDAAQADPARGRVDENNFLLQSSLEFRNRLAEIEHMRDIAIRHNDVQLMRRADQLEIALRAGQRMPSPQVQGQMRQQVQTTTQGVQRFQGNVQGQTQAGANSAFRGQQGFESNVEGRSLYRTDAAFQDFRDARGQTQQSAAVTAENSARAEADARARGEFTTSAAAGAIDRFRQGAEAQGTRAIGYGQGRIENGQRTAGRAADYTFRQGQDVTNNAQVRGEANGSLSTTSRTQVGPTTGAINQESRSRGQFDASGRQSASPSNPPPSQDNSAPQDNAPTQNRPAPQPNAPQPNAPTAPMSE